MPYSSSLSTHDDPGIAVAETIGQVLDDIGPSPDFAIVFMSGYFKNRFSQIHSAVLELLAPKTLMGCTADAVVYGAKEIEDQSALTIFAGNFEGHATSVRISDALDFSIDALLAGNGVGAVSHAAKTFQLIRAHGDIGEVSPGNHNIFETGVEGKGTFHHCIAEVGSGHDR